MSPELAAFLTSWPLEASVLAGLGRAAGSSVRGTGERLTTGAAVLLGLALVLLLPGRPAAANGGTLQVSRAPAGPYAVSVFTSPSPLRTGEVDVSVLVQRADADELVQDARVLVTAEELDHFGAPVEAPATHAQATNKLYYAAELDLLREGRWRFRVQVAGAAGEGTVGFEADVAPTTLLDRPLLLVALALLPVLLLVWWRSRARRRPRRPARRGPSAY